MEIRVEHPHQHLATIEWRWPWCEREVAACQSSRVTLRLSMTLILEIPDSWKQALGLDTADAAGRAREMLVIESYPLFSIHERNHL